MPILGNPPKEGSIIRPTLQEKKVKRRKFQKCIRGTNQHGQSWTAAVRASDFTL